MTNQSKLAAARWLHSLPRREQFEVLASWLMAGGELADLAASVRVTPRRAK